MPAINFNLHKAAQQQEAEHVSKNALKNNDSKKASIFSENSYLETDSKNKT